MLADIPDQRWKTYGLVATGLAVVAYLAAIASVGFADTAGALQRVGFRGVIVALSLSLLNYGLRFARWELYLTALGHPLRHGVSLRMYIAGFAWTLTPAKVGEALRGVLLARFGVPLPVSVAALLSERVSDLGAVVLLAMTGLAIYPESQGLVWVGLAASLLGWYLLSRPRAGSVARRLETARNGTIRTIARHVAATLDASRLCHRSGLAAAALAIGVAAWMAEAIALYLVLIWMGVEVPLLVAIFAYALAVLGGALSFMPGGIGGTEAVMIAVLVWQRVPPEIAVASTLLIRLTTLWFAVVLGLSMLVSFLPRRAD